MNRRQLLVLARPTLAHAALAHAALALAAVAAIPLSACKDPAKDAPAASVGAAAIAPAPTPAPAAAPSPAAAQAATYRIAPGTSRVEFTGSKVTGKHDGSFGAFGGAVVVTGGGPEAASIRVEIDMASVTTDNEKLTGHLKSPDFFDVAKFPHATFASTAIRAGADGAAGATHTITGVLDLHGVKRTVSFPATVRIGDAAVEANAEFSLNRKDFGIVYPGMPDDLIRDLVVIRLAIRAPRA
jgi:polyisoprenoid-binding protein YceI